MSNQRHKVILAVAGSLGLHVLALLLWALTVAWLPQRTAPPPAAPTPRPLKLTIETETPPPVAVATPTPTPPLKFRDTASMAAVATPPPDAALESVKNTAAGSELPATGTKPLPTQLGRTDPVFALDTTAYVEGGETASTPPPATAPSPPRAAPRQTPAKLAVAATPPPAVSRPGDFALATPASVPTEPQAAEPNPFDPSFRPPSSVTEPPLPTPVRFGTAKTAYKPLQQKTAISGSINNRGPASIASVGSPAGRYQGAVIDAVGRRWNGYIASRSDIAALGSVKIRFLVGMDGKARRVEVVGNSANQALASISLQAIEDAKIPPMPAEAVPESGGGQLPMEITFEFIDN